MKQKTISVKLTKERKRWSLTIEGKDTGILSLIQQKIQILAAAGEGFAILNLASPWAEIKPRKKKIKTDAKAPEGPIVLKDKELLNG
jgi:hypothetical protein